MLINTVLIFLNNALPALFLFSVTMAIFPPFSINQNFKIGSVVIGLLGAIILSSSMNSISQLFDGVGSEVIAATIHLLIFIVIVLQIIYFLENGSNTVKPVNSYLFSIGVGLVITLNGSKLLIYLKGFWDAQEAVNSILIGSILGLGISLSSALLLLYLLRSSLLTRWVKIPFVALVFATARQLSEFSLELIQADLIPSFEPLWNSSGLISDNSELGRFLNALLGYESSPNLTQTIFYFIGIIVPIIIFYKSKKSSSQVRI